MTNREDLTPTTLISSLFMSLRDVVYVCVLEIALEIAGYQGLSISFAFKIHFNVIPL